jgi:hypothetical protein
MIGEKYLFPAELARFCNAKFPGVSRPIFPAGFVILLRQLYPPDIEVDNRKA